MPWIPVANVSATILPTEGTSTVRSAFSGVGTADQMCTECAGVIMEKKPQLSRRTILIYW
jgi:hypothetical protein